ncbi:MAG: transporter substrate-binding domain-containing protein [Candidatus Nanopelagicales bacterium]|nr:transporter substrate-binding domain-containing protein [Candidatus Nanopelagicales bacterium]MBL6834674.1 transporter substrate-binding domain-containing protein [Candidatus Nanopelagicales bacterium]
MRGPLGLALGCVLLSACTVNGASGGATGVAPPPDDDQSELVLLDPCSKPNLTTVEPGALTFTTSATPAPPYFLSDQPADRLGLESELAYTVAEQLGFRPQEVTWEFAPAQDVLTGSFLDFDIAVDGYVARPEEFPAIAFSTPYLETTTVLDVADDDARRVLLGVSQQTQPSSLRFAAPVQGTGRPWLLSKGWIPEGGGLAMWARAGTEMQEARIVTDAQLIDEPTRQWLESVADIDVSNVAGVDPPDVALSFAMVQGNPLAACVDRALAELSESGELETITETWLNPEMWRIDD